MQASALAVKGISCLGIQNRKLFRSESKFRTRSVCMGSSNRTNCFGFGLGSVSMEAELTGTRLGTSSIFGSTAKPRSVRAQASGLSSVAATCFIVFRLLSLIWFSVTEFVITTTRQMSNA